MDDMQDLDTRNTLGFRTIVETTGGIQGVETQQWKRGGFFRFCFTQKHNYYICKLANNT